MDGLLIVDKPEGATSADVVRKVKRAFQTKTGHLGTLDPFATGVLPICLGQGTKVAQFLSVADKEYEGVIQLGSTTDTGDCTGAVVESAPLPASLPQNRLNEVAEQFVGDHMQTPPMYSAIKKNGMPLYRLARQGVTIEREARPIRIHNLSLQSASPDRLSFRTACSKGTYIRVLAEEISVALGTLGHVQSLRRVAFGDFRIDTAVTLADILAGMPVSVIGLRESLAHLPELMLVAGEEQRVRQGDQSLLLRLPPPAGAAAAKLVSSSGTLVAVVVVSASGRWEYARIFTE